MILLIVVGYYFYSLFIQYIQKYVDISASSLYVFENMQVKISSQGFCAYRRIQEVDAAFELWSRLAVELE